MAWAILIACGKGEKFAGDIDTAFLTLGSRPVVSFSLAAFEQSPEIEGVIVVAPKERVENVRVLVQMYGFSKVRKVVAGAVQRSASVQIGLKALDAGVELLVIHYASRPMVTPAQVAELVKAARKFGGAVLAQSAAGSIKTVVKGGKIKECHERASTVVTGYPQAFKIKPLLKGYTLEAKRKLEAEDDADIAAAGGSDVVAVMTERPLVRIAGPTDLAMAEVLLRS